MSHLVCKKHDRRVQVTNGKAIHRNATPCDTEFVKAGKKVWPVTSELFHEETDPEKRLLRAIFGKEN